MQKMLMCVFNEIDNDGRVIRSAEALSEKYNITVLSLDSGKEYTNEYFTNVRYTIAGRGFLKLFKFWSIVLSELKRDSFNILYLHDFYLPIISRLVKKRKLKIIYDAHELIIPEKKSSLRSRFFSYLERFSMKNFDVVISANQERGVLMKEHYNLQIEPTPIRNISKVNSGVNVTPKENDDSVVVLYQGAIAFERGVDNLLPLHKYLPENYKVKFVGSGPNIDDVRRYVADNNLEERYICTGRVPLSELSDIIKGCDIGIVTYSYQGLNNIYCSPNKVYEYTQSGLPILCSDQPPLKNILGKYEIGVLASVEEFKETHKLASIIQAMKKKSEYSQEIKRFLEDFNWENEKIKLLEVV